MKKIVETMLKIHNIKDAIKWINIYEKDYPLKDGYRIETFISPTLIHISVYLPTYKLIEREQNHENK